MSLFQNFGASVISSASILKYVHNKKIITTYDANIDTNIILKSHRIL